MNKISIVILFLLPWHIFAAEKPHYQSKYIEQQSRVIKSLSSDDILQLEGGKGWGLAKAAELNGMPGPIHLLQMKNKIALSKTQERKIRILFKKMKIQVIPLGKKLVALEKNLNESFASHRVTEAQLKQQLNMIAKTRGELRYIHLVAHLKTPKVLTHKQIKKYNKLRGYGSGDPCKNIPAGHNVEMWRKHNGCNR